MELFYHRRFVLHYWIQYVFGLSSFRIKGSFAQIFNENPKNNAPGVTCFLFGFVRDFPQCELLQRFLSAMISALPVV